MCVCVCVCVKDARLAPICHPYPREKKEEFPVRANNDKHERLGGGGGGGAAVSIFRPRWGPVQALDREINMDVYWGLDK